VELFLIRHADAAAIGEEGAASDADRPLTALGQQQSRGLAKALSDRGIKLEAVVSSPLLRARQTAEGLVHHWPGTAPSLQICEHLAPGGKRKRLGRFLEKLGMQEVALVGHQPDIECFASWLIGSRKAQMVMAKAGVAYIACSDRLQKGQGTLGWLLTPEWLGL
jgi:phosphohistidine phosphatase